MTMQSIEGTTVLITGANRGIGRAYLDEVLARGAARVYAAARRPESVTVVDDRVVAVTLDLADAATIEALPAACPDVDLLIANAGQGLPGTTLSCTDADIRALFEVNVFGPLALMRAFAPILRERRGAVLAVSSIAALLLSRSSPVYSGSKAALTMALTGLRIELRDSGVPVGIVYPGYVDTDLTVAMTAPKAAPRDVAASSLDQLFAGESTIFPDPWARIVYELLCTQMPDILRDPQAVSNAGLQRLAAQAGR